MRHREITPEQALRVREILVQECGYHIGAHDDLARVIATTDKTPDEVCNEYRFIGALGFGGKFRNNGNRDNTPYVDCYREHETLSRCRKIERANKRLAELFGEAA